MNNNQTIINESRPGQGMFIFGIVLILLALVGWNSFSFGPGAFLGPILFAAPFVLLGGAGVILAIVGLIQFFFSGTRNGGSPQVAKPFSKKVFAAIVIFAVLVFSYLIWSLYPYIVRSPDSQVVPIPSNQVASAVSQKVVSGNPSSGWLTATDAAQGLTFQYPKDISLFHSVDTYNLKFPWPPRVVVGTGNFTCEPKSLSPDNHTTVTAKSIHGHSYCVSRSTEGAAGTTYETYGYTTILSGKLITLNFLMYGPTSCAVYDNGTGNAPDNQIYNDCQKTFLTYTADLDAVLDWMMQSIELDSPQMKSRGSLRGAQKGILIGVL